MVDTKKFVRDRSESAGTSQDAVGETRAEKQHRNAQEKFDKSFVFFFASSNFNDISFPICCYYIESEEWILSFTFSLLYLQTLIAEPFVRSQ